MDATGLNYLEEIKTYLCYVKKIPYNSSIRNQKRAETVCYDFIMPYGKINAPKSRDKYVFAFEALILKLIDPDIKTYSSLNDENAHIGMKKTRVLKK